MVPSSEAGQLRLASSVLDPAQTSAPWLQEAERVMKTFKDHLHLPVTMIDDTATMMATLKVW